MPVLLQIDFTFPREMMEEALTQGAQQLAHSITTELTDITHGCYKRK